jgi:hypothetical protein
MHILLIHQAFASLHEPGGTRHYELARYLAEKGHRITVIASPVSYLTGKSSPQHIFSKTKIVESRSIAPILIRPCTAVSSIGSSVF